MGVCKPTEQTSDSGFHPHKFNHIEKNIVWMIKFTIIVWTVVMSFKKEAPLCLFKTCRRLHFFS